MVVDDRALPRLAAKAIMTELKNLQFVGEASSGREAVALYSHLRPDIVLLDVQMPELSGPDTATRLLELDPSATIVAWSVSDDSDDLLRMMQAGCAGYVLKDVGPQEMGRALQAALRGDSPVPRKLIVDVLRKAQPLSHVAYDAPGLSTREAEVLKLLGKGHQTKEIAQELGISRRSVDSHLRNLYRKLEVRSRSEAVGKALRIGLLATGDL
jgi:DNA-binding NarL/FixJ family response regulator